MIQLTKEEIEQIEVEALKFANEDTGLSHLDYYISGATSRAIKAKELVEALDKFSTMSEDTGRSGCNYGDTDYDSLSVVYGYNLAVEQIRNEAKQALLNYNKP